MKSNKLNRPPLTQRSTRPSLKSRISQFAHLSPFGGVFGIGGSSACPLFFRRNMVRNFSEIIRGALPHLHRGSVPLVWDHCIPYRRSGFPGGVLPGGLTPLTAGGATSGFVEMPGSRLGGFTAARGSACFSGICWIPGSIWEGGTEGVPDSKGF